FISVRNHLVDPLGRLFVKDELAAQECRSDLEGIIQIVQRRICREIKGQSREQRDGNRNPKLGLPRLSRRFSLHQSLKPAATASRWNMRTVSRESSSRSLPSSSRSFFRISCGTVTI